MATVTATPSAVFDVDSSGDAAITVTDSVAFDVNEMAMGLSADGSGMVTFSGFMADEASLADPDFSIDLSTQETGIKLTFEFTGASVQELLDVLGNFEVSTTLTNQGDALNIDLSGSISRKMLEDELLINATLVEQDPEGFRSDLESVLNEIFAALPLSEKPSAAITEFSMTGSQTLSINLKMSITGWNSFMAAMTSTAYQTDAGQANMLNCLGLSPNEVISSLLNSEMSAAVTISASGSSISGKADVTSASASMGYLSAINARITKTGSRADLLGSASLTDPQKFISCAMKSFIPGEYTVESLDYAVAKSPGSLTVQTLEASVKGLAQKSGGNMVVTIPAKTTSDMNVTVKVPSSMAIVSVSGGTQSGNEAFAGGGEDFAVTYGPKGGGDMTMWIIAAVVIVALAFLLLRKKKK